MASWIPLGNFFAAVVLIVCACVCVDSVHNVQLSYWKKKRQKKKVLCFLVGSSSVVSLPFPSFLLFFFLIFLHCHYNEPALLTMEGSRSVIM